MGRKDDKYGSPFDPNRRPPRSEYDISGFGFGGKMDPFRREPEEEQLRGCGDPNCFACNPHTAGRGLSGVADNRNEEQRRRMMQQAEELARSMGIPRSIFRVEAVDFGGLGSTPPPQAAGPPQSYKDAREKVEKYIVKADPTAFNDIVGNEEALGQLVDAIQAPTKHAKLYKAYGMKMPKGALLSGPPGCGKTMFARAAASEFINLYGKDVEFISIQGSDLQSPWIGVTEGHIRDIFAFGREYFAYRKHPLLVFMDEAEVLFPDRTGRLRKVAPWEESQVATFLAEMDGVRESHVFLLLATNRPEAIDSALLRDGRCDFKIVVKRPTKEAAESIIKKTFKGILTEDDEETLVNYALESFYDPNRIINTAQAIRGVFNLKDGSAKIEHGEARHFLLEDIVSGAMLVSLRQRAIRYAFARDKEKGEARGVTTADVLQAVSDLYEENKVLEHPFAQQEFMTKFYSDLERNDE